MDLQSASIKCINSKNYILQQEVTKFSKAYDNPGYSELPRESSHPTVKKGRTYEVNPQPDSESIRTSQKLEETPLTNGGWKQNEPSVAV